MTQNLSFRRLIAGATRLCRPGLLRPTEAERALAAETAFHSLAWTY